MERPESDPGGHVALAGLAVVFLALRRRELVAATSHGAATLWWVVAGTILGSAFAVASAAWERHAAREDLPRAARYVPLVVVLLAVPIGSSLFAGTNGTVRFVGAAIGYVAAAYGVGYFPFGSASADGRASAE